MADRMRDLKEETFRGKVTTADEDMNVTDVQARVVDKDRGDAICERIKHQKRIIETTFRTRQNLPRKEPSNLVGRSEQQEEDMQRVQQHVKERIHNDEEVARMYYQTTSRDVILTPHGTAV